MIETRLIHQRKFTKHVLVQIVVRVVIGWILCNPATSATENSGQDTSPFICGRQRSTRHLRVLLGRGRHNHGRNGGDSETQQRPTECSNQTTARNNTFVRTQQSETLGGAVGSNGPQFGGATTVQSFGSFMPVGTGTFSNSNDHKMEVSTGQSGMTFTSIQAATPTNNQNQFSNYQQPSQASSPSEPGSGSVGWGSFNSATAPEGSQAGGFASSNGESIGHQSISNPAGRSRVYSHKIVGSSSIPVAAGQTSVYQHENFNEPMPTAQTHFTRAFTRESSTQTSIRLPLAQFPSVGGYPMQVSRPDEDEGTYSITVTNTDGSKEVQTGSWVGKRPHINFNVNIGPDVGRSTGFKVNVEQSSMQNNVRSSGREYTHQSQPEGQISYVTGLSQVDMQSNSPDYKYLPGKSSFLAADTSNSSPYGSGSHSIGGRRRPGNASKSTQNYFPPSSGNVQVIETVPGNPSGSNSNEKTSQTGSTGGIFNPTSISCISSSRGRSESIPTTYQAWDSIQPPISGNGQSGSMPRPPRRGSQSNGGHPGGARPQSTVLNAQSPNVGTNAGSMQPASSTVLGGSASKFPFYHSAGNEETSSGRFGGALSNIFAGNRPTPPVVNPGLDGVLVGPRTDASNKPALSTGNFPSPQPFKPVPNRGVVGSELPGNMPMNPSNTLGKFPRPPRIDYTANGGMTPSVPTGLTPQPSTVSTGNLPRPHIPDTSVNMGSLPGALGAQPMKPTNILHGQQSRRQSPDGLMVGATSDGVPNNIPAVPSNNVLGSNILMSTSTLANGGNISNRPGGIPRPNIGGNFPVSPQQGSVGEAHVRPHTHFVGELPSAQGGGFNFGTTTGAGNPLPGHPQTGVLSTNVHQGNSGVGNGQFNPLSWGLRQNSHTSGSASPSGPGIPPPAPFSNTIAFSVPTTGVQTPHISYGGATNPSTGGNIPAAPNYSIGTLGSQITTMGQTLGHVGGISISHTLKPPVGVGSILGGTFSSPRLQGLGSITSDPGGINQGGGASSLGTNGNGVGAPNNGDAVAGAGCGCGSGHIEHESSVGETFTIPFLHHQHILQHIQQQSNVAKSVIKAAETVISASGTAAGIASNSGSNNAQSTGNVLG